MADTWHVARLKVDVRHEDDVAIIQAQGECDLITSRKLKEAADSLFNTGRCKIIFDLEEMDYIDSSGFRVLLEAKNNATERGGDIVLVSLTAPVERVYSLLRLNELVPRTDTVEQAIEKLKALECKQE